jgi:hypothetical protein
MALVGVVNMYGTNYGCRYLINAISAIVYSPHVIDGYNNEPSDVLKYIKDTTSLSHLPVIMLTTSASPADKIMASEFFRNFTP